MLPKSALVELLTMLVERATWTHDDDQNTALALVDEIQQAEAAASDAPAF